MPAMRSPTNCCSSCSSRSVRMGRTPSRRQDMQSRLGAPKPWRRRLSIAALVAVAWLAGSTAQAQGKLNVITTTQDLAAIAQEVGGDRITVEALARGYQDPHFVDAKPSFILKLQKADMLVVVGRELEIGWLPPKCGS